MIDREGHLVSILQSHATINGVSEEQTVELFVRIYDCLGKEFNSSWFNDDWRNTPEQRREEAHRLLFGGKYNETHHND